MENENTPETVNEEAENDSLFTDMTFDALPGRLAEACGRAGWDKLMPVQQKAIPFLLNDKDVMVQARTGSGKTGAFVLPLLEKLDADMAQCQALVMVPTRELAQQVAQEARMLAGDDGINVVAVYGGVGYQEQLDAFRKGAQLVVGTPGRILDHLVRRNLVLDDLKVLLFDEADRMLSVGFYPDMVEVKRYLPGKIDGSYMFSATFPQSVLRLAQEFMFEPEFLSLSSDETNVSAIAHQFVEVQAMGKERKLIKLIELENPSSAIIFSNTKRNVEFTAALLSQFGFDAEGLTSDLTQNRREKLMARIKAGKLRFLVATDVAARGIDIPELSHVFMMEPPEDPESYVHRAGRTGRAGATGTAITMVDVIQKMELERIASRFKIKFDEIKDPTEEDVAAIIEERLTALLEKEYRSRDDDARQRIADLIPLIKQFSESDDTIVLSAMLLDAIYQTTLHDKSGKVAKQPDSNGEPVVLDNETLTGMLQKQFGSMKHLERERASRFLALAGKYGQVEETLALVAMLLDDYAQCHRPPVPKKQAKPKKSAEKGKEPQKDAAADKATEETTGTTEEQQILDSLAVRLRTLSPVQQERVAGFLPIAEQLVKDEKGMDMVAMLLAGIGGHPVRGKGGKSNGSRGGKKRSDRGERPAKPRRESRPEKKDTPKPERKEQAPRPERKEQAPRPERKEQAPRREEPKQSTQADDDKPKRRRRPRRRRRRS